MLQEQELGILATTGIQGNKDNGTIDQALFPFGIRDNDVIGCKWDVWAGVFSTPQQEQSTRTMA